MAAHARTLKLDNSLFFAVSPKVFEVQKSIISHFKTLYLHNIFDSKLFEEQIALGLILELGAIWPVIIFKGCQQVFISLKMVEGQMAPLLLSSYLASNYL